MHSLTDLFPGATTQELLINAAPDWNCCNPSIAYSPVEGYRCIIRTVNWITDGGRYPSTDPDSYIRTRNLIATMDSELNIVDVQPIKECSWGPTLFPQVQNLEDARLYWAKDHWQVYGTLREHRYDGLPTIVTARLQGDELVDPEIYDNYGECQKNWMVMGQGPHFIYKCNPPGLIYNGVLREEPSDPLPDETLAFRGSSQAIPRGSGYIAVTHEVDWATGSRRYFHRITLHDEDGYLTGYTKPFYFISPTVEFAAGLIEHKKDFVISFGYEDSRAFLARIPVNEIVSKIYPIILD